MNNSLNLVNTIYGWIHLTRWIYVNIIPMLVDKGLCIEYGQLYMLYVYDCTFDVHNEYL
jgi:hypothetical protein